MSRMSRLYSKPGQEICVAMLCSITPPARGNHKVTAVSRALGILGMYPIRYIFGIFLSLHSMLSYYSPRLIVTQIAQI